MGRTTEIDLETARDKVRQLRAKQTLGLDVDGKKESRSKKAIPTLTEFMEQQYIPHKRDSGKRGWMRDRDLFHNHIRPVFGEQRLNEITLHSIQLFLSSMRSRGYAAATSTTRSRCSGMLCPSPTDGKSSTPTRHPMSV